ncbi:MAG: SDR family oxidoreductase [Eubacteriales bacterium]|nr:SDR family oxidoreductase [Eubacteriales bacterium]
MNTKTALITGSYGGLGTCFVTIHAGKGGDLILVGRDQKKLEEQAESVKKQYGVEVHTIAADLSAPEAAQVIYDTCKENGWTVDYLINNAGFGGHGDFARERTMEQDMSMIAVNIEALTRLCKLFLPDFIDRGSGRLLNVSSTAATMPGPLQAVYFASKAYVTSLSNALWRELKGTGVTVTALMPGAMQTGFVSRGGLTETKMFSNAVDPMDVAKDGYNGMLAGKLNVISGLPGWQKPMMTMAPMFPKKTMLDFVYDQHGSVKSGKNK